MPNENIPVEDIRQLEDLFMMWITQQTKDGLLRWAKAADGDYITEEPDIRGLVYVLGMTTSKNAMGLDVVIGQEPLRITGAFEYVLRQSSTGSRLLLLKAIEKQPESLFRDLCNNLNLGK